jgi:hypothetical protein
MSGEIGDSFPSIGKRHLPVPANSIRMCDSVILQGFGSIPELDAHWFEGRNDAALCCLEGVKFFSA